MHVKKIQECVKKHKKLKKWNVMYNKVRTMKIIMQLTPTM